MLIKCILADTVFNFELAIYNILQESFVSIPLGNQIIDNTCIGSSFDNLDCFFELLLAKSIMYIAQCNEI